ncbi:23222_t:CDS:2, partial [Racocetra persica]
GLETDNPRMRIGNMYFKGEYDESIGTDLVFCQEPDISNPRQQYLTYTCQTTKKLIFSRMSLHPVESQNNRDESDQRDEDSFS